MINQEQRASKLWNMLIEIAKSKNTITYGEAANTLAIHHRAIRFVLSLIQNYCLENNLAPLTILVVNKSGFPGQGFIAWNINNLNEGLDRVYNFDWSNIDNPFAYANDGSTINSIAESLLQNKELSYDQLQIVKVRGAAQQLFRTIVFKAYNGICAVCGLSVEYALEAAHIKSWSDSNNVEKISVNNGILFCSNHHKLFDHGILNISKDYIIKVNTKYKFNNQIDINTVLIYHNKRINLPIDENFYPNKEFLD